MAQLGADDVQVDQLAATFDGTSKDLATSESAITALVRTLRWTGPDAEAFKGKWNGGMRSQMVTVADRLSALAKELRSQADAQRTASSGDGGVPGAVPTSQPMTIQQEMAEQHRRMAEANARLRELERWVDETGRQQIRDLANGTAAEQRAWWDGLSEEQQAALIRSDPGGLSGLDGLPADVLADTREAYVDSVRGDLEISSQEDKVEGELNLAVVHLGVEGSAAIVQVADGTYRVDLDLDGEIGANLGETGAKGHVGIGAGVSQSYEFDSQADAEAFVDGLYDKLSPDPSWTDAFNPGALVTRTVDDVVGYLGDHGDQRTSFEGELRIEGEADLKLGAFDVSLSGEAGARYDFDSHETTLFVGGSASGELAVPSVAPIDGAGETGKVSLSADLEAAVTFDDAGRISELSLSGTFGGEGQVGIEQFLNGTNADAVTPQSLNLSAAGGADVKFDASLDLQDPIVQQRASELLNSFGSGGVSLAQLQSLLQESEVQIQVDAKTTASDGFDVGIAKLEISETDSQNLLSWVKPPGGDFIYVPQGELREDRSGV